MARIPAHPGQLILDEVAVRMCPLLPTREFVKFCNERNLTVSAKLLHRLEEMRVFTPIIRIAEPDGDDWALHLDGNSTEQHFSAGLVEDCSAPGAEYSIPALDDPQTIALYSAYQIWTLECVLRETTATYQLHEIAGPDPDAVDWSDRFEVLRLRADKSIARLRSDAMLSTVPILCQLISNRYLPHALGNERTIQVNTTTSLGQLLSFGNTSWDWNDYRRTWEPVQLVEPFALDQGSLERIHWRMVSAMHGCDPLWDWRNLIQFVRQQKRDKLRGDALRAETYRQCAEMLRRLLRDLYDADPGPPEDALHGSPSWIPEASVRENPREHLQYVVNQYDLNPQPKAVLLVEGETEVVFTETIFRGLFRLHHGVPGIEILNLRGVNNATGGRRDLFHAIFLLVDYLLAHQTLVFLLLDNENQAKKLKEAADSKPSLFGTRHRAIAPDRIHLWEQNFELDNFSDDELARAMTVAADGRVQFTAAEIQGVRVGSPAESLSKLFLRRADRGLKKPLLGEALAQLVVDSPQCADGAERPIVEFLLRVRREASRNPLPLTQDIWRQNQEFLDAETSEG